MEVNQILAQARLNRFTTIFFNFAVTMFCIVWVALLSSLLGQILYFFVLASLFVAIICMIIFTLGIAFAIPGNPVAKLWGFLQKMLSANDSILHVTQVCFNATKWISLVALVLSLIALILVIVGKKQPKVGKSILLSVFMIVSIVVFVFQLTTGGIQ